MFALSPQGGPHRRDTVQSRSRRMLIGAMLLLVVALVWVEGAVGVF